MEIKSQINFNTSMPPSPLKQSNKTVLQSESFFKKADVAETTPAKSKKMNIFPIAHVYGVTGGLWRYRNEEQGYVTVISQRLAVDTVRRGALTRSHRCTGQPRRQAMNLSQVPPPGKLSDTYPNLLGEDGPQRSVAKTVKRDHREDSEEGARTSAQLELS
ncbi:hypothetical protein F5890DRAFT_1479176 [Lentinula detonsa]|uniref:Uncharacterized protein n=1 Tax=Lentinula detonsa TaxID=2804962 RepID=A0AA38UP42_9AGAR|nr:hypothetical protein F5890DRAFT_1479176 [Lentinula detonsa]